MKYFIKSLSFFLTISLAYSEEQSTVFVANEESNTISVLNLTKEGWRKTQDIEVGDTPTALTQVDSNTILVTNSGEASVSVLKRTNKGWENSHQDIPVGEGAGAILLAKPSLSEEDKHFIKRLDQLLDPKKRTEIEIVTKTIPNPTLPNPTLPVPVLETYESWANKVGELAIRTPKALGTLRDMFEANSFDWRNHPSVPYFLEGLISGLSKNYGQTHQDVIAILNEKKQQLVALKK